MIACKAHTILFTEKKENIGRNDFCNHPYTHLRFLFLLIIYKINFCNCFYSSATVKWLNNRVLHNHHNIPYLTYLLHYRGTLERVFNADREQMDRFFNQNVFLGPLKWDKISKRRISYKNCAGAFIM